MQPYLAPLTHHNLRAFQRARALAGDVFWITRRFRVQDGRALIARLREAADALPSGIAAAWSVRALPGEARRHRALALAAADALEAALRDAADAGALPPAEADAMLHRLADVRRYVQRLAPARRRPAA